MCLCVFACVRLHALACLCACVCVCVQMLKDEHQALQLAFTALEDKYQKAQDDNRELIERWMAQKARDADIMNEENAIFMRWAESPVTLVVCQSVLQSVSIAVTLAVSQSLLLSVSQSCSQ